MSDMQMGTRGLSSGDLTRLRRLRGAGNDFSASKLNILGTNRDVNPTPVRQLTYTPNLHNPRHMGSSRIRRTASSYTDFKGFMYADSVSQSQQTITSPGKLLVTTRVCNCSTSDPRRQGLCIKCVYDPKWQS